MKKIYLLIFVLFAFIACEVKNPSDTKPVEPITEEETFVDEDEPFEPVVEDSIEISLPNLYEDGGITGERARQIAEDYLDSSFDYVIKNPGIRYDHPLILKAIDLGIKVENEVEVAYHFLPKDAFVIAVTGANGKTTTTTLISEIIKEDGKEVDSSEVTEENEEAVDDAFQTEANPECRTDVAFGTG